MATLTFTLFAASPKAVHVGVNNIQAEYRAAGSLSVGDVLFVAKIPNGAIPVDMYEAHSSAAGALGIDMGLAWGANSGGGANLSAYASAKAMGLNRYALVAPLDAISLSASDVLGYGILALKVASGSMTLSATFHVNFSYRVDG